MADGNAVDWFVDRHTRNGDASGVAFEDPWRSLTRGALARNGITRERRLVMLMLDTVDFPVVFWGALRAGVIPVPVNALLTPELVSYVLRDSRAEVVAISEPLLPVLRATLRDTAFVRKIIVARPEGSILPATDAPGAIDLVDFLA